jgi:hypothetical protein
VDTQEIAAQVGFDELEALFEQLRLDYLDPFRASVVPGRTE